MDQGAGEEGVQRLLRAPDDAALLEAVGLQFAAAAMAPAPAGARARDTRMAATLLTRALSRAGDSTTAPSPRFAALLGKLLVQHWTLQGPARCATAAMRVAERAFEVALRAHSHGGEDDEEGAGLRLAAARAHHHAGNVASGARALPLLIQKHPGSPELVPALLLSVAVLQEQAHYAAAIGYLAQHPLFDQVH